MSTQTQTVSKGETVLITGASGWLGSHIAEVALEHGLSVRLASRSQSKIQPLVDALSSKYSSARVSVAIVEDFAADGAYDDAVSSSKNGPDGHGHGQVTGIVHAASDVTFSDDYDSVVGSSLKGYESVLAAAKKAPQIKRVIFTSSSVALGLPNVNNPSSPQHLTPSSWNDAAVTAAQDASKRNAFLVYAASKVITERRVWEFVSQHKPHFTVNVVNPNFIMGAKVPGFQYGSTGHWLRETLIKGDMTMADMLGPQYHVDAYDTALLHVLALTREDIQNERILAFGDRFTWSQLIDLVKEVRPDLEKYPDKTEKTDAVDNTTIDTTRSKEILKEYGGFKDLRHSVKANLAKD